MWPQVLFIPLYENVVNEPSSFNIGAGHIFLNENEQAPVFSRSRTAVCKPRHLPTTQLRRYYC
jgi:hypothetical protein